jgi:hypothetical protein
MVRDIIVDWILNIDSTIGFILFLGTPLLNLCEHIGAVLSGLTREISVNPLDSFDMGCRSTWDSTLRGFVG